MNSPQHQKWSLLNINIFLFFLKDPAGKALVMNDHCNTTCLETLCSPGWVKLRLKPKVRTDWERERGGEPQPCMNSSNLTSGCVVRHFHAGQCGVTWSTLTYSEARTTCTFVFLMHPQTLCLLWHTVCYFCILFSSMPHLNKTVQVDCMYKCGEASFKKKVASMNLAWLGLSLDTCLKTAAVD